MLIRQLFDPERSTYTYLIADPAAVLEQVDRDLALLADLRLTLTHAGGMLAYRAAGLPVVSH